MIPGGPGPARRPCRAHATMTARSTRPPGVAVRTSPCSDSTCSTSGPRPPVAGEDLEPVGGARLSSWSTTASNPLVGGRAMRPSWVDSMLRSMPQAPMARAMAVTTTATAVTDPDAHGPGASASATAGSRGRARSGCDSGRTARRPSCAGSRRRPRRRWGRRRRRRPTPPRAARPGEHVGPAGSAPRAGRTRGP